VKGKLFGYLGPARSSSNSLNSCGRFENFSHKFNNFSLHSANQLDIKFSMGSFSGVMPRQTPFWGFVIGWFKPRRNRQLLEWTISVLDLQPADRVLEIGSGSGRAIQLAAKGCTLGLVAGVDSDPAMVRRSRKRNALNMTYGRVFIREGSVSNLPYPDASFDKVFSINSVQTWASQLGDLKEVRRVLRPEGKLFIVRQPLGAKNRREQDQMREDIQQRLPQQIALAGFDVIGKEVRVMRPVSAYCVVGSKIAVEPRRRIAAVAG
jgi:ubiquinone/menaquinone biosynthesis C-methylase UbiE